MAGSRLQVAGAAANAQPNQSVNSAAAACSGNCADKWAAIQAEVNTTLAPDDPLERNKRISAAYAEMNQRRPEMEWIGLAAVVSRQARCAMEDADTTARTSAAVSTATAPYSLVASVAAAVPWAAASVAKNALVETNKLIFSDIYPVMRFYEQHGKDVLEACQGSAPRGKGVPDKLMDAVKLQDQSTKNNSPDLRREASNLIAEYEQRDIVQNQVYSQLHYRAVFTANEVAAEYSIGRFLGARPAEISLSSECGGTTVPMDGSITSDDDRVAYYEKLMKEFDRKGEAWRKQTMSDIAEP